ncbi:hypothetical protein K443DRAFT_675595 [Laccaria amethystina LaAM-08-1]|uniref:Uncharacterized protein n=1 Tax=Laccaria amethystina LaAM-08-1 TaxID=1095629 RepID=A0A0C9XIG3_9AGAR|nr:hypothetical protein K443DRAFT_675595 [Laccaria amethystina LaAM-08-1]
MSVMCANKVNTRRSVEEEEGVEHGFEASEINTRGNDLNGLTCHTRQVSDASGIYISTRTQRLKKCKQPSRGQGGSFAEIG